MKKYLPLCLFILSSSANANLINSYDFTTNLSDTLNNGLNLTASGGEINAGRYSFTDNQGLRLASALPGTTDYAIEIKMQINGNTNNYNKIIDFQDLVSDRGLYINNGLIKFYSAGPANTGAISIDTDFTVGLARAGDSIDVYLNNTLLFSAVDNNQAVSAANILNFFEDDNATGQRESFTGSVDFIRIHDDASTFSAVPVPAAVWLFGSSLLGIAGMRKVTSKTSA